MPTPRIGVLYQSTGGEYAVAWFDSDGVEFTDRSWLLGGGAISLRIQEADSNEAVAASQLEVLGVW